MSDNPPPAKATSVKSSNVKVVPSRKRRGVGIYMQNILYKQVTLPFHNIGNNVAELLTLLKPLTPS